MTRCRRVYRIANTEKNIDLQLVKSFIVKEIESRPLEELPPQELDLYLSTFILAVRKKNGEEYEPTTLWRFIASVEHYLKKCRYSKSIITGQNFTRTREVLKSKQKQLKRLGKLNSSLAEDPDYVKLITDSFPFWLEEFSGVEDKRVLWDLVPYSSNHN